MLSSSCRAFRFLSLRSRVANLSYRVRGRVAKVIYSSPDSSYTVGKLNLSEAVTYDAGGGTSPIVFDEGEGIIFTGNFAVLGVGFQLRMLGDFITHPRHGLQFKAHHTENDELLNLSLEKEVDQDAVEGFLGSGLIYGVGPATAKKIVNTLGSEAVSILNNANLEEKVEKLETVPGIGAITARKISKSWVKVLSLQRLGMFLARYDIPISAARKLYQVHGANAENQLRLNPYRLIEDISGIGFLKADSMAQKLGLGPESVFRIKAIVKHVLKLNAEAYGHCYLTTAELTQQVLQVGQLRRGHQIERHILKVANEMITRDKSLHMRGEDQYCLPDLYWAEMECAQTLNERLSGTFDINQSNFEDPNLSEQQLQAVNLILWSPVSILTGGPGTGKTFCLHAVTQQWLKQGLRVRQACPTARAAQRLQASTKLEATTIHRLLEFAPREMAVFEKKVDGLQQYESSLFARNKANPIEADAVIIDEASMVDIRLAASLLAAVPQDAKIVFVGDNEQLPSVGPGYMLGDLIESGFVPTAKLTETFRQAGGEEGEIVRDSHRIRKGMLPVSLIREEERLESANTSNDRVMWLPCATAEEGFHHLTSTILTAVTEHGLNPKQDMQVLCMMNKGDMGSHAINKVMQEVLNPIPSELQTEENTMKFHSSEIRLGDRVMQITNNYDINVMNGQIGKVIAIDKERILVKFEEVNAFHKSWEGATEEDTSSTVPYTRREIIDNLTLSYACSIHKAQGSEYPAVVIPVFKQHTFMMKRNLLYTAISRATNLVVFMGEYDSVAMCVDDVKSEKRNTALAGLLGNVPQEFKVSPKERKVTSAEENLSQVAQDIELDEVLNTIQDKLDSGL